MTERPLHVLGVVASLSGSSRSRALVEVVLEAASGSPAVTTEIVTFADRDLQPADGTRAEDYGGDMGELLVAIDAADAVVFGMPVYRASHPGSLKNLLDAVPRGQYDGDAQALRAKPVAIAATGATDHHFLALNDLAEILRGFYAAYVIPPGLYASHARFTDGRLTGERVRAAAIRTGRALVELRRALDVSPALSAVEPLV
jgi:FMN reductase